MILTPVCFLKKKKNVGTNQNKKEKFWMKNEEKNKKDNSEKKNSLREKIYFIILLLVIVMIVSATIMLILSFFCICPLRLDEFSFAILISGLAIFVTGTILIPKFLLEKEVKNAVIEYAEKAIQEKAKNCIDEKIQDAKNDNFKTDAHLSRMIAFGLTERFPVWSIGWGFRSLKRYIKLDASKIGFEEYKDFVVFIQTGIIEKSSDVFLESFNADEENDYSPLFKKIKDEAIRAQEKNVFRPSIRTIKDIADFEYMVFTKKCKILVDYESFAKSICRSAGNFARVLAKTIMYEKYRQTSEHDSMQNTYEWLLNEILEISDFGHKSKSIDDSKKYKIILQEILTYILPDDAKNANKNNGDFFFIWGEEK